MDGLGVSCVSGPSYWTFEERARQHRMSKAKALAELLWANENVVAVNDVASGVGVVPND